MRILVTGGAGFIGSHLVDAFLADGHEVVTIDNLLTGVRENLNPRARFYEADIRDEGRCALFARERPEVLCHQAAQLDVRRSVADPAFDADINPGRLAAACCRPRRARPQEGALRLQRRGDLRRRRRHPRRRPIPPRRSRPTARRSEPGALPALLSRRAGAARKLRYANVYGPRQNPHGEAGVIAIFAERLLRGEPAVINGDGGNARLCLCGRRGRRQPAGAGERPGRRLQRRHRVETDVNAILRRLNTLTEAGAEEAPRRAEGRRAAPRLPRLGSDRPRSAGSPRMKLDEGLVRTVEFFIDR